MGPSFSKYVANSEVVGVQNKLGMHKVEVTGSRMGSSFSKYVAHSKVVDV